MCIAEVARVASLTEHTDLLAVDIVAAGRAALAVCIAEVVVVGPA